MVASVGEAGAADDDSEAVNKDMDLHTRFVWEWDKRKPKLQHKYAMAGFALSIAPTVWRHAAQQGMLGAEVRRGIEFVVKKLHRDLNPNRDTWDMSEAEIVDRFWTEFADFCNRRGAFGATEQWDGRHVRAGSSHLWHEKYSLPWTKVLGFVACRVTSKNAGIGMCE